MKRLSAFLLLFMIFALFSCAGAGKTVSVKASVRIEVRLDAAGKVLYEEEKKQIQTAETPLFYTEEVRVKEGGTVKEVFSALAEKTGKAAKFDETAGRITLLEGVENQGGAQWYAEKDGKSVRFTAPVSDGDEIVFVFAK